MHVEHKILGIDFSSAPGKNKAITVAVAKLSSARTQRTCSLVVQNVALLRSMDDFAALVAQAGPWVMGIDAPFSQPYPLVAALGWHVAPPGAGTKSSYHHSAGSSSAEQRPCQVWRSAARHAGALEPAAFKAELQRFCDGQPAGQKHLKRRCDALAGAVSPISSVRTPVAQMYHRLAPILARAGVCVAPYMCSSKRGKAENEISSCATSADLKQGLSTSTSAEATTMLGAAAATAAPVARSRSPAAVSADVDPSRVVVEVYPSLVARRLIAARAQEHVSVPATQSARHPSSPETPKTGITSSRKRSRQAAAEVLTEPSCASTMLSTPTAAAGLPRHAPPYKGSNKSPASSTAIRAALLQAAKQHCATLYGFELVLEEGVEEQCVADSKGDVLDAVFAAMQAGWACLQGPDARYGAPAEVQAEGWIHEPWMEAAHAQSAAQPARLQEFQATDVDLLDASL